MGSLRPVTGLDNASKGAATSEQTDVTVGTATVSLQPVAQYLTLSSELVPNQEIEVYAKVAGYVKTLNVDYGSLCAQGSGHGGA